MQKENQTFSKTTFFVISNEVRALPKTILQKEKETFYEAYFCTTILLLLRGTLVR